MTQRQEVQHFEGYWPGRGWCGCDRCIAVRRADACEGAHAAIAAPGSRPSMAVQDEGLFDGAWVDDWLSVWALSSSSEPSPC